MSLKFVLGIIGIFLVTLLCPFELTVVMKKKITCYLVEVFWAIGTDPNDHGCYTVSIDQRTGKNILLCNMDHVFKFSISNSHFQGIFNFDSKMEATTRSREVTSMAGIQSAGSSHMTGHLPTMEIKSEPMSIESCSVAKTFEVISISDLMNFIFFR